MYIQALHIFWEIGHSSSPYGIASEQIVDRSFQSVHFWT